MVFLRKVTVIVCVFAVVLVFAGCRRAPLGAVRTMPEENFNPTGMPIVNEPIELTVLTMRWGDMGDSFTQNQWLIDLEERTNIRINWQVVSSSDWPEQRGIMLASRRLPDIIMGHMTFGDADIMNNLEFFHPLDDLIERYMPNYRRAMELVPTLRNISVFPDGRIYSLARNLPARPQTRNHPVINRQWLDELGLEIPTTIDELTDVLRAFRDMGPIGGSRRFPLSFHGSIHIDLLNPFGITDIHESFMTVRDGVPFFWPASPEYREALRWVRQLWVEGLIDPETFTQDFAMLTGKRLNPSGPQIGMSFEWTHDAVFGHWSYQYVAIPPIAGPDGRRFAGGDPDGVFGITRNEALITVFCYHPGAAARWLDEFFTSEASIQNFWGAIGTVITENPDGTFTLNDPPPGISADAWYWEQSLRDFGPKFIEPGFNDRILLSDTSGDGLKMVTSRIADPYVMEPFPNVIYTRGEIEDLMILQTDIGSFVMQMQARWITQGGIDEEWDNYIAQLERMGLARLIQIRTDAFNRFRAR